MNKSIYNSTCPEIGGKVRSLLFIVFILGGLVAETKEEYFTMTTEAEHLGAMIGRSSEEFRQDYFKLKDPKNISEDELKEIFSFTKNSSEKDEFLRDDHYQKFKKEIIASFRKSLTHEKYVIYIDIHLSKYNFENQSFNVLDYFPTTSNGSKIEHPYLKSLKVTFPSVIGKEFILPKSEARAVAAAEEVNLDNKTRLSSYDIAKIQNLDPHKRFKIYGIIKPYGFKNVQDRFMDDPKVFTEKLERLGVEGDVLFTKDYEIKSGSFDYLDQLTEIRTPNFVFFLGKGKKAKELLMVVNNIQTTYNDKSIWYIPIKGHHENHYWFKVPGIWEHGQRFDGNFTWPENSHLAFVLDWNFLGRNKTKIYALPNNIDLETVNVSNIKSLGGKEL